MSIIASSLWSDPRGLFLHFQFNVGALILHTWLLSISAASVILSQPSTFIADEYRRTDYSCLSQVNDQQNASLFKDNNKQITNRSNQIVTSKILLNRWPIVDQNLCLFFLTHAQRTCSSSAPSQYISSQRDRLAAWLPACGHVLESTCIFCCLINGTWRTSFLGPRTTTTGCRSTPPLMFFSSDWLSHIGASEDLTWRRGDNDAKGSVGIPIWNAVRCSFVRSSVNPNQFKSMCDSLLSAPQISSLFALCAGKQEHSSLLGTSLLFSCAIWSYFQNLLHVYICIWVSPRIVVHFTWTWTALGAAHRSN